MIQNQSLEKDEEPSDQPVAARTRRFSRASSTGNGGNNSSHPVNQTSVHSIQDRKSHHYHHDKTKGPSSDVSNQITVTVDDIIKILQKEEVSRTREDLAILDEWSFMVPNAKARLKSKLARKILKQRAIEQEESLKSVEKKVDTLAEFILKSRSVVFYTGAGISTSASIPDYRGPNGLWTQIRQKGHYTLSKFSDLSAAEPTLTHMAIKELCRRQLVKHVVSQNCDGLHLRSGILQNHLSEIHGNMYIEVCPTCEKQYFRQADVTDKTSRFRHKTGRKCHSCPEPNNNLIDTIVLFGERSRTTWPMNWERASKAAESADLIVCMGSSLKTLVRYGCLWPKRSRKYADKEPETKLVIINLQYTPKDDSAALKITGKCDLVMQLLMQRLNIQIPAYDWSEDPLLDLATPFTKEERATLKRNLIFDAKTRQPMKRPLSTSPSLFVSEITDDPNKKHLKMRIRARNSEIDDEYGSDQDHEPQVDPKEDAIGPQEENPFVKNEPDMQQVEVNTLDSNDIVISNEYEPQAQDMSVMDQLRFSLPGWLGKSLGNRRASSYRRKRHGNKGKKHSRSRQEDCNQAKPTIDDQELQLEIATEE